MFIREFEGHKYRIYANTTSPTGLKVIAVSSFAGKTVKGIAKCAPEDTPDLETGIMLAILRCNAKIAYKKVNRIAKRYEDARKQVDEAHDNFKVIGDLRDEYLDGMMKADDKLYEFEKSLKK